MRFFTGQYERSIDEKNRIQLPSPLRNAIDPERDGRGLYVTLGEDRGTLSIFTERGFEELAGRIETEFMSGPDAKRFELQFFGLTCYVEVDPQGRFVLPERLLRKARVGKEVFLMGRKNRIDLWSREALDQEMGIDWEDPNDWPKWHGFLRMRPGTGVREGPGPAPLGERS
jgi:MraZ protein